MKRIGQLAFYSRGNNPANKKWLVISSVFLGQNYFGVEREGLEQRDFRSDGVRLGPLLWNPVNVRTE